MNTKLLSLLILLLGLTASASAQTQRPNTSAPAPSGGAVPMAKIGMLDLALLRDGVAELKQRYEKLNAEFAGAGNELSSMQTTLDAKAKVLSDQAATAKMTQQQVAKLSDDYQSLKKEFDRKQEDYEGLANKRAKEETDPIYTKILSFLDLYAKQRGLTMVLEAGAARETQTIVFRAKPADITDDFIKEYNKAYPVAPAAPPAVKKQ